MGRYLEIESTTKVEVDLYDIVEDIVELYNSDKKFRERISGIGEQKNVNRNSLSSLTRMEILDLLKILRKDPIVWYMVKPDLEEMMKENYVVVM